MAIVAGCPSAQPAWGVGACELRRGLFVPPVLRTHLTRGRGL